MANNDSSNIPIVLIIGVPRSGTSILGRVLDAHPRISTWVEPYYIWDHHFRDAPHDQKTIKDASIEVRRWIRKAFGDYLKVQKADVVADKSPRNCLKIPFIQQIFPEARYIFIHRDGRDTTLSIMKQWEWKRDIFAETENDRQVRKRLYIFKRWLSRRPTWQFRLKSILFELGPPGNWIKKQFLPQIRWEGRFGWGPRFKGWQEKIDQCTTIEFSAHQWLHCARGILDNKNLIPEDKHILIRYEDFIKHPKTTLEHLFRFLNLEFPARFMDGIPPIWANNSNKWRQALSAEELMKIGPIIGKALIDFGYEINEGWYQPPETGKAKPTLRRNCGFRLLS